MTLEKRKLIYGLCAILAVMSVFFAIVGLCVMYTDILEIRLGILVATTLITYPSLVFVMYCTYTPPDRPFCFHDFEGGHGGMGDAFTCTKCNFSKYPESIPLMMRLIFWLTFRLRG